MTIAKRLLCSVLLLLLALSACLVSCKNKVEDSEESDDALSVLLDIVESAETTAEASCYVIVLPADCSSALVEIAGRMREDIEELVETECFLEYDNSDTPRRDNSIEIIIGNTERDESKIFVAGLRANDYICKKVNGNIVIGGSTDSATIMALNRFIEDVLPYASSDQLMSSGAEFRYLDSYKLDGVKLCGFPIGDFDIVCADRAELISIANRLSYAVLKDSGYVLDVLNERRNGFKEITLELARADSYVDKGYIIYDGEDVTLRAYDLYGMNAVVEKLRELLLVEEQTSDVCLSEAWTTFEVDCPNKLISVEHITFDESASGFVALDCISAIHSAMSESAPAVVVMSEMSESVWNIMKLNLPRGYSYYVFGNQKVSAVVYDTSAVELSAQLTRTENGVRTDIDFYEPGGNPSYRITYLYSDTVDNLKNVLSKVNDVISEKSSDLVLVEHSVATDTSASASTGMLPRGDALQPFVDELRYVDVFGTGRAINYSNASADRIRGLNGGSLGFACRVTRVSFNRAEFVF